MRVEDSNWIKYKKCPSKPLARIIRYSWRNDI